MKKNDVLYYLFFIFLILIVASFECDTNLIHIKAQSDESLILHQTNFSSTKYFDVLQNTEINITAQNLRLVSNSSGVKIYENFDNWNEVDSVSDYITRTNQTNVVFSGNWRDDVSVHLSRLTPNRDTFRYVAKIKVDVLISSSYTMRGTWLLVGDSWDSWIDHRDNNLEAIGWLCNVQSSTTEYRIVINHLENGVGMGSAQTDVLSVDTNYFVVFNRTGWNAGCYVYSDKDLTNLITSCNLALSWSSNYYFNHICIMQNVGYSTSLNSQASMANLWNGTIQGGYSFEGLAYTNDLGENTTSRLFDFIVNATINEGTEIRVYGSQDNITYTSLFNISNTGYESYILDQLNVSQYYLMFNLLGDGIHTPQIENFWFTEFTTPSTSSPPLFLHPFIFVFIVALMIIIIISQSDKGLK